MDHTLKKMKLSDYIVKFLENGGVKDAFLISGGLAMHLDDSFGKSKKIKYYSNFHEQASAMAAEGYAKVKNDIAVCVVTAGPGSSNAITGVVGQWQDSVPVLYISGQVRTEFLSASKKVRQYGEQELNIIDIVKPITKYAVSIREPNTIRYHLQKAVFLAKNGRPGPVWIEVPLDIQAVEINEKDLKKFDKSELDLPNLSKDLKKQISLVEQLLNKAKRPVILAGNGIRIAGGHKEFLQLADLLQIPVVVASCANDIMYASHKLYFGAPGLIGDRAANFAIQNSDLVLSIGSRLNFKTISFNYKSFAREAKLVVVDIDKNELQKKSIRPTLKINADAKLFIAELMKRKKREKAKSYEEWIEKCNYWKSKFNKFLPQYLINKDKHVNPYYFIHVLSGFFKENDIVVTCNGITAVATFLMADLKKGQRLIANIGTGSMGYDLPAAIGACIGNDKKPVILTVGDGSIQFNIQELQTIVNYNLPIKIFVFDNKGYLSIRTTQKGFFNGRFTASDNRTGVTCPDMEKIAKAYGIPSLRIKNDKDLRSKIRRTLKTKGPVICVINMPEEMEVIPKMGSKILSDGKMISRPMEDMYPYQDREDFKKDMIIKPVTYEGEDI